MTLPEANECDDDKLFWERLAECLDRLILHWETRQTPPELRDFLPEASPVQRRLTLVELIKVDLEHRWTVVNSPRPLEDYLIEFPELRITKSQFAEIAYEEFKIRQILGDEVTPADYLKRFPEYLAELQQLFGVNENSQTQLMGNAPALTEFFVGDRLDDFELLLPIGKGAFGTVFLARQTSMQRLVALKIGPNRGDDEPQTLAQLDHPHVVRVFDQRMLPEQQLRLLYMEFVAGGTLQGVIAHIRRLPPGARSGRDVLHVVDQQLVRVGQLAPEEALFRRELSQSNWPATVALLGMRCASGLEHAHQRGVLHRDIKPANVLLSATAMPKIADFNISYARGVEGAVPEAFFGGSLAYMSPEQLAVYARLNSMHPKDIDARSDVYSLGILLWELLTGTHPFGQEQVQGNWLMTAEAMFHRRGKIPEPPHGNGQRDPLVRTLRRCLEPDPLRRLQTANELAQELELALNPELLALVEPPISGWPAWAVQWPRVSVALAAVTPNLFAALFNFTYNRNEIIERLPTGDWLTSFMLVQGVINAIAFPLGVGLVLMYFEPIARSLPTGDARSCPEAHQPHVPNDANASIRRLLPLGYIASLVSLAAWLLAGIAYPLSMHALVGQFPLEAAIHFFASLAICGLIAASYPFLMLSYMSLRAFQPQICNGRLAPLAGQNEQLVARRANVHLVLAATVPLISIALLTLFDTSSRFALGWLSVGGTCGFLLAFALHQAIQRDVKVLGNARRSDFGVSRGDL